MAAAFLGLMMSGAPSAGARDVAGSLADAEAKVGQLEGEVPALQGGVASAAARYRSTAQQAAPALRMLRRAEAERQRLRGQLTAQEQKAKAQIDRLQERHRQEDADQDEEVRNGVGFGLAALVAGLIALAWGWFRASAAVAALVELDLARAIGVCVGGGLLLLVVGAVLGASNGAVGAFGSFIFCLGLILPIALLLARHSAEVQRERSNPVLRRERLPAWVSMAAAGLMFVLFLAGTGSAIFAGGAESAPITPRLEREADAGSQGRGREELAAARARVEAAKQRVAGPLARRNTARARLASARQDLGRARRHLAGARSRQHSFQRQLVALKAKEQREAEKREREEAAQLQIEEEERLEIEEEAEEELASECDPNYSGCLDPYSSDYDCSNGSGDGPDYTGTVEVLGEDHYGLDDDGDGTGCDLG
jgi:hypothetical protein